MTTKQWVNEGRRVDYELEGLPPGATVQVIDQVVYVRHVGEVPFDVSFGVLQRVAADPQIEPGWSTILDLLQLVLTMPGTAEIRAFVNDMSGLKQQFCGKFAVVTNNPLHYGFARMISMLAEFHDLKITVFKDLESAEAFVRSDS